MVYFKRDRDNAETNEKTREEKRMDAARELVHIEDDRRALEACFLCLVDPNKDTPVIFRSGQVARIVREHRKAIMAEVDRLYAGLRAEMDKM